MSKKISKNAFTMADRLSLFHMGLGKRAFTMAEILLSLTIIGVVAAITLPSLIGNINERTWNTQKKALHARMAQALALMPQLNGYGTFVASTTSNAGSDNTAQTFITEGLSKVLKITNVCTYDKLTDCGVASTYTTLAGSTKSVATDLLTFDPLFSHSSPDAHMVNSASFNYNTKAAAFETQNGESIILYYNPYCQDNKDVPIPASASANDYKWDYAQQYMCANFVVDLNGAKGPNKVGQDISFITAIYPNNPDVVAPDVLPAQGNDSEIYKYDIGSPNATTVCKNIGTDYRLPTLSETMAMSYNRDLIGLPSTGNGFWSGTTVGINYAWGVGMNYGNRIVGSRSDTGVVRCVKR